MSSELIVLICLIILFCRNKTYLFFSIYEGTEINSASTRGSVSAVSYNYSYCKRCFYSYYSYKSKRTLLQTKTCAFFEIASPVPFSFLPQVQEQVLLSLS